MGRSPSLRDWQESNRTPEPNALTASSPHPLPATDASGAGDVPSLQEWENKHLTPIPGSLSLSANLAEPTADPPPTGRTAPAAHKVRGPLDADDEGVPDGVFGDISVAVRESGEMPRARSYSSADLHGAEDDMLSDDDEDAFASLAAESDLETGRRGRIADVRQPGGVSERSARRLWPPLLRHPSARIVRGADRDSTDAVSRSRRASDQPRQHAAGLRGADSRFGVRAGSL